MSATPIKIVVAAGADYQFTEHDFNALDALFGGWRGQGYVVKEILADKTLNAGTLRWAEENKIKVRTFAKQAKKEDSMLVKKKDPTQRAIVLIADCLVALTDCPESWRDDARDAGIPIFTLNPKTE